MPGQSPSSEIKELSLLFEISRKLSESLDLKAVLKPILQMTAEHMQIPRGTLTILNRNRGEFIIEESYVLPGSRKSLTERAPLRAEGFDEEIPAPRWL